MVMNLIYSVMCNCKLNLITFKTYNLMFDPFIRTKNGREIFLIVQSLWNLFNIINIDMEETLIDFKYTWIITL